MPIVAMLRAKYDFVGSEPEELSFKAGESIYLMHKDESGWAKGKKQNGERGWFPSNYTEVVVDVEKEEKKPETKTLEAPLNSKIPEHEMSRYMIVAEILSTEKAYHRNLVSIVTSWLVPLRAGNHIDAKYLPKIFSNIEEILTVSTKFLGETEAVVEKWAEKQMIGPVFLQALPEFSCYETYLRNHHTAILLVNQFTREKKSFAAWIQSVKETKECGGLDLLAYLIMPVQRILRYKLLVEELKKNTSPNHPDYANLLESLNKIAEIAVNVNESIKEEENFQALCRIQKSFGGNVKNIVVDNRKFIREGPVMKICRKTDKPRWFFLFSDVLVYASTASGSSRKSSSASFRGSARMSYAKPANDEVKYVFHRMVYMDKTRAKSVEDTTTLKNAFQIITTEEKSFIVYTETPQDKAAWLKDFASLQKNDELELTAPVWQQDSEAKACVLCSKSFNVVQRRHHCRYCGKLVCGSCSSQKARISHLSSKPVRLCKNCYEDLKKEEGLSSSPTPKSGLSRTSSSSSLSIKDDENSPIPSPRESVELPDPPKDKEPPQVPKELPQLPKEPPPKPSSANKPALRPKLPPHKDEVEDLKRKISELSEALQREVTARLESEKAFNLILQNQAMEIKALREKIGK